MKDERVFSVGAVAVAPSDPRVIWVGTGEATDRNSAGFGDGVFRSTDGGATWTHVGLEVEPGDRADPRPPGEPRRRLRGRLGRPLDEGGRARPLPDDRRREELDEGPLGRLARRRRHGLRRRRPLPRRPERRLRGALRAAAGSVGLHLRRGAHRRPRRGRHLPLGRRRRDLDEAGERPPGRDGPHRARHLGLEPEGRHGGRPERRGRDERDRRDREPRRRDLPLGGRGRDVGPHLAPEPAPLLLQPDPDRPGERPARLRPRLRPLRLGRRRKDVPRGPLREGPSRLPRARRRRDTRPAPPRAAEGGRAAGAGEEARLAAPLPRDRRRRLPERRRGRDVGPRRLDPVGAVLPDLPRRRGAVPDLRRPAGQRELGRPEPHLHEGRHRQRRLDPGRRRRRLLVRLRPRSTATSSTPSRRRGTSTASTSGAGR